MAWYGENRSNREYQWNVGDLIRYGDGPTALMRINYVRQMGQDARGIACSVRYYGRAFHDTISYYDSGEERASMGWYHGQCLEPSPQDIIAWTRAHDSRDDWKRGVYSADGSDDMAATA